MEPYGYFAVGRIHLQSALSVLQTGDFEGKHSRTIFEIYERLSAGRGILPPAIAFIFDRERRREKERTDLERQSRGTVKFISRRMYENYLLSPEAIVAVVAQIENFREQPITHEEVQQLFEKKRMEKKYYPDLAGEIESLGDSWINEIHAAHVLEDMFSELSEGCVRYDKVRHDLPLTNWLVENSPKDLAALAELLDEILGFDGSAKAKIY